MRMFRVLRGIGSGDYTPGSIMPENAVEPVRLRRLLDQRIIEPVAAAGDTLSLDEIAELRAIGEQNAELRAEIDALKASMVALTKTNNALAVKGEDTENPMGGDEKGDVVETKKGAGTVVDGVDGEQHLDVTDPGMGQKKADAEEVEPPSKAKKAR